MFLFSNTYTTTRVHFIYIYLYLAVFQVYIYRLKHTFNLSISNSLNNCMHDKKKYYCNFNNIYKCTTRHLKETKAILTTYVR